jgi:outer membrane receptor protein involved in Fe transport
MNKHLKLDGPFGCASISPRIVRAIALCAAAAATPLTAQETAPEEEVFELSPFVVDATDHQGYLATSTLAGTRIRTNLADLGAAISVVTQEFMEDIQATDAGTLMAYVTNTEVGGAHGNFSSAS